MYHKNQYYINKLSKLGKLLWLIRAFQLIKTDNRPAIHYTLYNPVGGSLWLLSIVEIIVHHGVSGLMIAYHNHLLGTLPPYWQRNKDRIKYVKH